MEELPVNKNTYDSTFFEAHSIAVPVTKHPCLYLYTIAVGTVNK